MLSTIEFGKIFLLSLIEGLTEFIPVSSTGHLIIVGELVGFNSEHGTFEIAIQLGAIIAVCFYYKTFFIDLIKHFNTHHLSRLIIAASPVLALGFISYDIIKTVLMTPNSIAIALITGSIIMIIADKKEKKETQQKTIETLSKRDALNIGLFQCLALWPGMSRSGATICGGIFNRLNHNNAAKFSFILGVHENNDANALALIGTFALAFASFVVVELKDNNNAFDADARATSLSLMKPTPE